MSKIRDALFESHKADPELLGTILNSCDYFSLPLSMVIHGDYGSGKTRLLKIIEASAIVRKIPCTFFHASQYEPSQINLARVLLTKMGAELERIDRRGAGDPEPQGWNFARQPELAVDRVVPAFAAVDMVAPREFMPCPAVVAPLQRGDGIRPPIQAFLNGRMNVGPGKRAA